MEKWTWVIVGGTIILVFYEAFKAVSTNTSSTAAASTALADSVSADIGNLGTYGGLDLGSSSNLSATSTLLSAYNNPLDTEQQQLQLGAMAASQGISDPSLFTY